MIYRVLIALLGAVVITSGLLLGMDAVTSMFRDRDDSRYYRITDILPRRVPGRPERPAPGQRQPDIPAAELSLPDAQITLEQALEVEQVRQRPSLEPPPDAGGQAEAGSGSGADAGAQSEAQAEADAGAGIGAQAEADAGSAAPEDPDALSPRDN